PAQNQGTVLDRDVQFELPEVPALHPRDVAHSLAGCIRAGHEPDADGPLDRIRFIELDPARQLPLDAEPPPVLLKAHLNELVHRSALLAAVGAACDPLFWLTCRPAFSHRRSCVVTVEHAA